ncbi:MAG: sigma-70 family RNA polymerase sigma factor [Bacteroidota bacterium]
MPELSEQTLLKKLAENDSKATEIIYKNNFNMVRHFILNNSGDHEDAKDVFQEAMIVLYENAKTDSFVLNCQIKTYLYSVCRRLWLKRLQQAGRVTVLLEGMEETTAVDDDLDNHQKLSNEFALMEKAMDSLGEPCKSLLEAYYLQKKGMDEIARKFGYTNADNAKNQKYKCMMRLKKIFFAHYNIGT